MIGVSGTDTEQRYLHEVQVPGLFNWTTRSALGFYALRLSGRHYVGATYQFEQLISSPNGSETQIHNAFLFYTLHVNPMFAVSLFGGPQYFQSTRFGTSAEPKLSPGAGASVSWQRLRTSGNVSFTHRVTDGGGLQSVVVSDAASLWFRRQLTRTLTLALFGNYSNNRLADQIFPGNGGHIESGSLSVERTIGEHCTVQLGYTRAHQSYSDIPIISSVPDRTRAWGAVSYTFRRPLGR
jgi:hypothetical protein